jgi:D-alanyl-D-alanine carboxypeptidase
MFDRSRNQGLGLVAVLAFTLAITIAASAPAEARRHHAVRRQADDYSTSPTDPSKDAALIVDGETGKVLYARNEDSERHPASLTKMMTLYLLFDALRKGQIALNSTIPVSAHAAAQKPTNLHLSSGDTLSVDLAIKAIVVRSANDVAVAVGEALGGTESHFAELMTAKARALGMRNTFYHNASGLPDNLQITTASDLAILARHLAYDFPQYYHYFSTPAFVFRGIEYPTHDNLIGRYRGADGIKTGYTGASGFNLVSSVVRDNAHVIGVVMGGRTARKRDKEMVRLLDNTFDSISRNPMLVARAQVPWQVAVNTSPIPALAQSGTVYALPSGTATEGDDEDTAESRSYADETDGSDVTTPAAPVVAYNLPKTQPAQTLPTRTPPLASFSQPRTSAAPPSQPNTVTASSSRAVVVAPSKPATVAVGSTSTLPAQPPVVTVASYQPKPTPAPVLSKPAPKPVILGEGDVGDAGSARPLGLHDWTIQIGAFADLNLARAQLAAYAEKSMDVLGQAQRIVVPFQSTDGHTLYRARFGPFVEREARQICARLTERGQTCFAAISTR